MSRVIARLTLTQVPLALNRYMNPRVPVSLFTSPSTQASPRESTLQIWTEPLQAAWYIRSNQTAAHLFSPKFDLAKLSGSKYS